VNGFGVLQENETLVMLLCCSPYWMPAVSHRPHR